MHGDGMFAQCRGGMSERGGWVKVDTAMQCSLTPG